MDAHPCSYCGKDIPSPQDAYTIENLSEIFDLMWCSEACAKADCAEAAWHTRLRKEQALFEQIARESGPLEFY